MHTQDTIQRFLELRALGQTLFSISGELKVPISTLGDWNKRHAQHLNHERAVKWEHCEKGAGLNIEADLIRLARRIYTCELELGRRPLHEMKTSELLKLLTQSRREYFRRRDPFLKPLHIAERGCPSRSASAESESNDASSAYAVDDSAVSPTQDSRHSTLDSALSFALSPVAHEVTRGPYSFETSTNQPPSSAYAANDSLSTTHVFSTASETNDVQSSHHGHPLPPSPAGRGNEGEGQTSSSPSDILHSEFSTLQGQTSSSSPTQDSRLSTLDSAPSPRLSASMSSIALAVEDAVQVVPEISGKISGQESQPVAPQQLTTPEFCISNSGFPRMTCPLTASNIKWCFPPRRESPK